MTKHNKTPNDFREDIVADVLADFAKRQKQRRPYELAWQLNMNFVMGNQYCSISPRGAIEQQDKNYFWQEKQVFNHIAPIVETRLARLNRVRPKPIARPFGSGDADVYSADLATKILTATAEKLHLDQLLTQATAWSETCGTAFYKIAWEQAEQQSATTEKINAPIGQQQNSTPSVNQFEPSAVDDGQNFQPNVGDVVITICSPFEIYPDSNVTPTLEDCASLIHAKVYPASEVTNRWGVDIDGKTVKVFSIDGNQSLGGYGYNTVIPSISQENRDNQVVVIERYTKPTDQLPNGKLEIVAGNVLLYVGDLPYTVGEKGSFTYPFVRQTSIEQPGCFWGASVVERVIPIQRAYNAVKNRKQEFLNRLAMGVLTVEDGSVDVDGLQEDGLCPGKILVYRQGSTKPQLLDSGTVPTAFAEEEKSLLNEFVTVSGVSEFARNSSTPTTVTSGVALQLIAEQDDIRLASSIDSVRQCIKALAKAILRMYKQFVNVAKLMRLAEGKSAQIFYFVGSDISADDVVFETENELTDTPATRRTMLFDLLKAGILTDEQGKLSLSAKTKILQLMGFGNWHNAQDLAQMHVARADKENLDITHAEVLPVDDHALHVEQHTRFVIGGGCNVPCHGNHKNGNDTVSCDDVIYRDKIIRHIAEHQKYLAEQTNLQKQQ